MFDFSKTSDEQFAPYSINKVTFEKVEIKDYSKDGEFIGKQLVLTFRDNTKVARINIGPVTEEGALREDMGTWCKSSDADTAQIMIQHVLEVLAPEFFEKLLKGQETLKADTWPDMCEAVMEAIPAESIGKEVFIKASKNSWTPKYVAKAYKIDKDLEDVTNANVTVKATDRAIGSKESDLFFTAKEKAEKDASTATPSLGGLGGLDPLSSTDVLGSI